MGNLKRGLLMLALLAVLGLAACDSGSSTPTPTNGPSNPNAELVKQAGTNMKALKSYHVEAMGSMGSGDLKISGDFDIAANNSRISMTGAGMDAEMVQIGSDTYTSGDGGKTYTKSAAADASPAAFIRVWDSFNPTSIDKNAANFKDGTPLTATIDGVTTRHITASSQDLNLSGNAQIPTAPDSTLDLWISTEATPTVRQMKLNGGSGPQAVNLTFTWSHLNENLDIKAPPTQ